MRAFMDNFRKVGNELRISWHQMHHYPKFKDSRPMPNEDGLVENADHDFDEEDDSEDSDDD
jgi:hypothetical protein